MTSTRTDFLNRAARSILEQAAAGRVPLDAAEGAAAHVRASRYKSVADVRALELYSDARWDHFLSALEPTCR